jgi:hypothetical protein
MHDCSDGGDDGKMNSEVVLVVDGGASQLLLLRVCTNL